MLASFSNEKLQSYNLVENLSETCRVYVHVFPYAFPSHTQETCVKTQVSVLRQGYIVEG